MESGDEQQTFELSGGRLCLDFANTLTERHTERPHEGLNSYLDLVAWSRQAGAIDEAQARRLSEEAEHRPIDAAGVLVRAKMLREATYRVFSAISDGHEPEGDALASLNAAVAETLARSRLVPTADGYEWRWAGAEDALDRLLWPVAWSAADLLTSGELGTVRECAAPDCQWLFVDASRNRSRRWCDMKSCGNRAKARRHYHRKKAGG